MKPTNVYLLVSEEINIKEESLNDKTKITFSNPYMYLGIFFFYIGSFAILEENTFGNSDIFQLT